MHNIENWVQKNFIEYAEGYTSKNDIHIRLGGSFVTGAATRFSDIDVYIHSEEKAYIENYHII